MHTRWIMLMLALSLVLAACGTSTPASPTDPASAAPTSPPAAPAPDPTAPLPTPATASDAPGANPPPSELGSIDACALIATEEASAILGADVTKSEARQPFMQPGNSSSQGCLYRVNRLTELSLEVYQFAGSEAAASHFKIMGNLGPDSGLSGIGDEASGSHHDSLRTASVIVRADAYYFELSITTDNADRFTALQAAAATIVERLP